MRLWLSGPRLFNGLVRPGISLGKEDFRPARKAPAMVAEATLGLFRRPDGAILMAIAHMNGDAETMPDMTPVAAFAFTSVPASVEVREGARVRLAKHIGPDGLVAKLSVGQVVAAIKAEMAALDVEGKFVRIEIEAEPGTSTPLSNSTGLGRAGLPQHQSEHSSAGDVPPELAIAAVTGAAANLGQSLSTTPPAASVKPFPLWPIVLVFVVAEGYAIVNGIVWLASGILGIWFFGILFILHRNDKLRR